ncbi:MAG: PEP-CTERM sorting domain-containing protein [Pseudomonadota bacterium]
MKIKSLALAAALALTAGAANAALTKGDNITTGSSLMLIAYDTDAQVSYVKDLGTYTNDFYTTGKLSPASWLVNDGEWSEFLAASTVSNINWLVLGYQGSGAAVESRKIMTTAQVGTTHEQILTGNNNNLNNTFGTLTNFVGAASLTGTHLQEDNGSSFNQVGEGPGGNAYFMGVDRSNAQGNLKYQTNNLLGATAEFVFLARPGTSGLATPLFQQPGYFTFGADNTGAYTLSYAPVPEPSTYALMVAGLAAVGLVARRRAAR